MGIQDDPTAEQLRYGQMKITTDLDTKSIVMTMYHNGHQAVLNLSPKSAKLLGELLIDNANKLQEYIRENERE